MDKELEYLATYLGGEVDPEDLLLKLEEEGGQENVYLRLRVLVDLRRYTEAVELSKTYPLDLRWIPIALEAAVWAGEKKWADSLLEHASATADGSDIRILETREVFSTSALQRHMEDRKKQPSRVVYAVSPEIRGFIEEVTRLLRPIADKIARDGTINSKGEENLLSNYVIAVGLCGISLDTRRHIQVLAKAQSPALLIAILSVENRLPVVPEFGKNLVNRFPGEFESEFFAHILQNEGGESIEERFRNAIKLKKYAKCEREFGRIYALLCEIAESGPTRLQSELERQERGLLNLENASHRALVALNRLACGDRDSAARLLSTVEGKPDYLWCLAKARLELSEGRGCEAVPHLKEAAISTVRESFLLETADLAHEHEKVVDAEECLEILVRYYPYITVAEGNLAYLLAEQGKFDEAVQTADRIISKDPEDERWYLLKAQILTKSGDLESAVQCLTRFGESHRLSLQGVVLKSYVLQTLGRTDEAFEALSKYEKEFWQEPQFLHQYMALAYAIGSDEKASMALSKLISLSESGDLPREQFWRASIEDIKAYEEQYQEAKTDQLHRILRGELPWTANAEILNVGTYWEWAIRTQPVDWLAEAPTEHARLCTYVTNNFGVQAESEGQRKLVPIQVTRGSRSVCVDISALISLHELGLLETLPRFYSKIYLPAEYLSFLGNEQSRLLMPQKRQIEAIKDLSDALVGNQIQIQSSGSGRTLTTVEVDVKVPGEQAIATATVLGKLEEVGAIASGDSRIRNQSIDRGESLSTIAKFDDLLIGYAELKYFAHLDILKELLETFNVYMPEGQERLIHGERKELDLLSKIFESVGKLRAQIRKLDRVKYLGQPLYEQSGKGEGAISVYATQLADAESIDLLVDDRALQAALHNMRGGDPSSAYSVCHYVRELYNQEVIGSDSYLQFYLQMVRWRYRFLQPDSDILFAAAKAFSSQVPGRYLKELAAYVHDCMRDNGLFGGQEPVEPPISIAISLFLDWHSAISEFLVSVWTDPEFEEDQMRELTAWAATVLYPSVPRVIDNPGMMNIVERMPRYAIAKAVIQSGQEELDHRVSEGLHILGYRLGLDDMDIEETVCDLVEMLVARNDE